jgi:hypothetical protein
VVVGDNTHKDEQQRTLRKNREIYEWNWREWIKGKIIFINHQNHLYIGVCTIGGRGSLNKPTNKSKPL